MPTVCPLPRVVSPTRSTGPARRLLLAALLAVALLPAAVHAQDGATTAATKGQNALNGGDYPTAIAAFQEIVDQYKMSLVVPEAYAKLGYAQFLTDDLENGEKNLRSALAAVNISPAVKEFAMDVLPQVLSAKAAKLEEKDAKIKMYADAIKAYDDFLAAFPQTGDAEATLYGKALAQYFSDKYAEASETLSGALTKFSRTESAGDTKYLLGVAKAAEGGTLLMADQAANLAKGMSLYSEALKQFVEITAMQGSQRNLALINDANFQMGEVLFNEGVLETDPAKQKDLMSKSLAAYRAVQPLEPMLEAQEQRVNEIFQRINTPDVVKNPAEVQRLLKLRDRERVKLNQLRQKPPQTLDAKLKVARIFNQLGQLDESRVILKFLGAGGFPMSPEQQKQVLYYLTLSYGLQNRMDLALANYEAFQAEFAGDAMAENLPLVIGNLFLTTSPPQPEKALEFFDKGLQTYPKGQMVAATQLAKGQAYLGLSKFDEAIAAFDAVATSNPIEDIAAGAQLGKGVACLLQSKWDDAIKIYQGVVDKYPTKPVAKEAQMRMAYAYQQKGDLEGAVGVINRMLAADKDSPNAITAKTILGEIQVAQGKTEDAVKTYNSILTDSPASPEAPVAMLQIASIYQKAGDTAKQEEMLHKYLEKFPEDQNNYFAYTALAANKSAAGNNVDAAAVWGEFAAKYPTNPNAAVALLTQAQLLKGVAEARGGYSGLDPAAQTQYVEEMRAAIAAAEKLVREQSESTYVPQALALILAVKKGLAGTGVEKVEEIPTYFEKLAADLSATPAAQSRTLFVLAGYVQSQDPEHALSLMQQAYNPSLVYAAEDLDIYGAALLDQKKTDEAGAIYEKILSDYPIPEGADPKSATREIQMAQSIGLYGLGKVAEAKGDATTAGENFEKLKTFYPWSSKIREADYGIAAAMRAAGKFDDAIALLTTILKDARATPLLKGRSILLIGHCLKDKGQIDSALDNYKKIYNFYSVADEPAAEGLWQAAQIYKSKGMTKEHDDAIGILKAKYPNTKWATQPDA